MNNFIEVVHPKWGIVKLEMKQATSLPASDGTVFHSVVFYYPSGNFMGEWDEGMGGGLGHPDEKVDAFIRSYQISLLDLDDTSYCTLEDLIKPFVEEAFPGFLLPSCR